MVSLFVVDDDVVQELDAIDHRILRLNTTARIYSTEGR